METSVPLSYFDLYDGDRLVKDEFGVELDDLHEAREQAIALLTDHARDGLPGGDAHGLRAIVRCREGRVRHDAKLSPQGHWIELPIRPPNATR